MLELPGHDGDVLYLRRDDVVRACGEIDIAATVADALLQHAKGATILPEEAYLGWQAPDGASARSLTLPGAIARGGNRTVYGLKVINGSLSNPARGLARAQGFIMLFDPQTARPTVLMEAAHVSAMRTAGVTAVTLSHLAAGPVSRIAFLGCGTLARAHLILLASRLPSLREVRLFDLSPLACQRLAADLRAEHGSLSVVEASGPEACVRGAEVIIAVTTTTTGYLAYDWLSPGALLAQVSLDDARPEVALSAGLVVVDDWGLVSADRRRLLGRMFGAGELLAPDGSACPGVSPRATARRVDATLGDILAGTHPGRTSPESVVLSNPFGMAILDVALADAVATVAREAGVGQVLEL